MEAWWAGIPALEQVLFLIGAPSALILLIQTILLLFSGGGGDQTASDTRGLCDGAHVLAHSLGGIASLDLIRLGMAQVDLLVTVGSQGSYLCSLGALPSAPNGASNDVSMPRWMNFYDPRDLLSYLAKPVFGDVAEDVEIRSGAPFPRAHSAYFALEAFYTKLRPWLPR